MEQFRVIFVSDLHIGASPNWLAPRLGGIKSFVKSFSKRVAISVDASQEAAQHWMAPSSHDPQAIDALGAWLYQERNTIDAVCISGDIGRTGEQSDYAAVSAVLTGSASKSAPYPWQRGGGEPSLSFLNDDQSGGNPIFVPGNHDRFTGIMMSPTSRAFEHLFYPQLSNTGRRFRTSSHLFRRSRLDALRLIVFDSSLTCVEDASPGSFPFHFAQGRVDEEHRKEIVQMTEKAVKNEGAVPIWVVHHPPIYKSQGQLTTGAYTLNGWDKLLYRAATSGVPLIIGGHFHEKCDENHGSVRVIANYSAAEYGSGLKGFLDVVFSVDRGMLVNTQVRDVILSDESAAPAHRYEFAYRK